MTATWHLITGEYPPKPGGVSDYTRLVAGALAEAGAAVHVWTPRVAGDPPETPGVTVHREAPGWAKEDRERVGRALDLCPSPRRLVVQYVPGAWGQRGANLGFTRWLRGRLRKGDEVWAMVHEGFYIVHPGDPFKYRVLALIHRMMMRNLLAASTRVYYSMPYWDEKLRAHEPRSGRPRPMSWLPVPSTIPVVDDPAGVASARARVDPGGRSVIGHFGTFGPDFRMLLGRVLPPILEGRDDRSALLIGRGGREFADALVAEHPGLAGRVEATGGLPAEDASRHIQACDLMLQPYEYGVSTRRTTAMAGLAHGRAIATTFGEVTEPLWAESACVAAVDVGDLDALPSLVDRLLADPAARDQLGRAAGAIYESRFTPGHTADVMLRDAGQAAEPRGS
jgi:glycosyltransferase involved in cell wall biosynthesis